MFFRIVYKSGQIFLPFCHNTRVWQTDRRTDGQTNRRTDRILITIPRLHYMQRGKNSWITWSRSGGLKGKRTMEERICGKDEFWAWIGREYPSSKFYRSQKVRNFASIFDPDL